MTLYRISKDLFVPLKKTDDWETNAILRTKKESVTMDKSFIGVEYILAKGQDTETVQLTMTLFYPPQSLRKAPPRLEGMKDWKYYGTIESIHYLDPTEIAAIYPMLAQVTDADIRQRYDADDMNDKGIYPSEWHNDNSPDLSFNISNLLEDIKQLKKFFKQAVQESDYVLSFAG